MGCGLRCSRAYLFVSTAVRSSDVADLYSAQRPNPKPSRSQAVNAKPKPPHLRLGNRGKLDCDRIEGSEPSFQSSANFFCQGEALNPRT